MAGGGNSTGGVPPAIAQLVAPQGQGVADQMRQRALQPRQQAPQAGGVVDDVPEPSGPAITWPGVVGMLKQVAPDAPPGVVAEVMNGMAPLIAASSEERYKAWKAKQDLDLKDATRLDKLFTVQQQLDYRYATTQSAEEKSAIQRQRMANQLEIQKLTSGDRRYVADKNADTRVLTTNLNNQNRFDLAQLNNDAKGRIADNALALRKELGSRGLDLKSDALDLKADEIAKTVLYRERVLDLKEKGLDQSHAEALAKLEVTKTLATMRDQTTQRGQDLMHEDRIAAEGGRNTRAAATLDTKTKALQTKALPALTGAVADLDAIREKAEYLLTHPGLDDATGPIDARIVTLKEQTANFEADLESLKADLGFSALQNMRQLSPTGGALGNVSNYEVKTLQAKIASLVLAQGGDNMRKNLLDVMDYASKSKTNLLKAYETQYGGAKAAGSAAGVPVARPDAPSIDVPAEVANEPDGTVFKMGGKTYTKKGAKAVETAGP